MKLCKVEEQSHLTEIFPGKRGAELTITLSDGRILCELQDDVLGLSKQEVKKRFESTMKRFYSENAVKTLIQMLESLEQHKDMSLVFEILKGKEE